MPDAPAPVRPAPRPLQLSLITNHVGLAEHAVASGVDRLFVDLETLGKEARQGHLDTHRADHTPADVAALRRALPGTDIMARVNPPHAGTADEVEAVVRAGASHVMLPMFETADEVEAFLDHIGGRADAVLLLETPQALTRVDAVLEHRARIAEVHVGLNDLHLGLGLDFMFEVLSGGLVEYLARAVTAAGVRFGFGGIACVGEGAVPAEWVLGEHVRLGSEMAILSRAFHRRARTAEELRARLDLGHEIGKVRASVAEHRAAGAAALDANRRRLQRRVRELARERRQARV